MAPPTAMTERPTDPIPSVNVDTASAPSDREQRLVGQVRSLFQHARDKRRPIINRWNNNYRVLHEVGYTPTRSSYSDRPEVTEIFAVIDAIISWTTDQTPKFYATPFAEMHSPFYNFYTSLADDLTTCMRAAWYNFNYDAEVEKIAWDGYTYGIGFSKVTWNQALNAGIGDFEFSRRDPFSIYWDPNGTNEDDIDYLCEVRHMSLQQIERRWPGSIAKINFGGGFEDHDKAPNTIDPHSGKPHERMTAPGAISPATSPRWGIPGQAGRLVAEDDPGATVIECWMKVPVKVDLPDDLPSRSDAADSTPDDRAEKAIARAGGDSRTYDSWRCVVVCANRVLFDEPATELWSHDKHPYGRFVLAETGQFVGPSLVEKLEPLQTNVNKILAAIQHNIDLMGNPILVADALTGISRARLTNKPGTKFVKDNPQSDMRWMDPPQMHPQMAVDMIRFLIDEMERISGLSAVVRGASPSGRNAQGVIDSISEAAFVRIRKTIRNMNRMLRSQATKAAALVSEFYDEPRLVAIAGTSGRHSSLALRNQHFYTPSPEGRMPLRFTVRLDVDSSLPTSRQARAAEADTLLGLGVLDRKAVLEAHEWPNADLIDARMNERDAMMAQQQQPTQRQAAGH